MGVARGEELHHGDGQKENIHVSIRLRPPSEKEKARNDIVSDWECINNTTILFRSSIPERAMFPSAYAFDRVFSSNCSTRKVYEEGAKEVALAVLSGINSSVFAYGQTSSGKTYTMSGITEYAVADVFDYIESHQDREHILKFSAIEIYNESVRDLLSADSTPLRLLDDPEKGTVIERLIEETIRDRDHFQELISLCEAHRQIGETSLNEMSSRSHQILRLTIVSSARAYCRAENPSTLAASVNFVDLAGSERASQTLSAGQRLKEGSHINRSLLTLGTVIRKLSKGRNSHIPYRDSKLTRILQNSLGGNARTAIICTINPARSHVEQSRNTLLFASCAKEVTTSAQVNVVMSDKALVKQLQRELARLESELRGFGSTPVTSNSTALLKEKEHLIEKMEKEIAELTQQRDLAQSQVQDLLQTREDKVLNQEEHLTVEATDHSKPLDIKVGRESGNECRTIERLNSCNVLQFAETDDDNFLLDGSSPRLSLSTPNTLGPDPSKNWDLTCERIDEDTEDICKEVRCIEMEERSVEREKKPDEDPVILDPDQPEQKVDISESMKRVNEVNDANADISYESLKKKIQDMQKTINCLVSLYPVEQSSDSSEADTSSSKSLRVTRSRSCKAMFMALPQSPWEEQMENEPCQPGLIPNSGDFPSKDSHFSGTIHHSDSEDLISLHDFGLNRTKELQPKLSNDLAHSDQQIPKEQDSSPSTLQSSSQPSTENWPSEFASRRREIIELWNHCNVPLVHRTYFFLLFRGDPSDAVYTEVELRRLSFLKSASMMGSQGLRQSTSLKALNREREMLARRIAKKFSRKEREALYQKWGIGLNSKQRSLHLARRLWSDTMDIDHAMESAQLISKLVVIEETGSVQKEMFELSFTPKHPINKRKSFTWRT